MQSRGWFRFFFPSCSVHVKNKRDCRSNHISFGRVRIQEGVMIYKGFMMRLCSGKNLAHKGLLEHLHLIYQMKIIRVLVPQLATWLRHKAWPLRSPALLAHRLSIRTNNSRRVKAPARVVMKLMTTPSRESFFFFFLHGGQN